MDETEEALEKQRDVLYKQLLAVGGGKPIQKIDEPAPPRTHWDTLLGEMVRMMACMHDSSDE